MQWPVIVATGASVGTALFVAGLAIGRAISIAEAPPPSEPAPAQRSAPPVEPEAPTVPSPGASAIPRGPDALAPPANGETPPAPAEGAETGDTAPAEAVPTEVPAAQVVDTGASPVDTGTGAVAGPDTGRTVLDIDTGFVSPPGDTGEAPISPRMEYDFYRAPDGGPPAPVPIEWYDPP